MLPSLWSPSTSILEWCSLPHCLGQLTSSTWWTEATDYLHNACFRAVPNTFRCTRRHPSSWCTSCPALLGARNSLPHHPLPSRVWIVRCAGGVLAGLSLDGQTQNGSRLAVSPPWPMVRFQLLSSRLHPGCQEHGPLAHSTCVTPWAHLCLTRVASFLDHLHLLSHGGGLSPKSVISLTIVCTIPDPTAYGRGSSPDHARAWGLARWGDDPCPEGRHSQLLVDCRFCHAAVGDMVHCLSECPWFEDLRTDC